MIPDLDREDRFVLTETGNTVHIAVSGRAKTFCGRRVTVSASATETLWFPICAKCRRHAFGE